MTICQKVNGDNYQQRLQFRYKLAYQTGIYILIVNYICTVYLNEYEY